MIVLDTNVVSELLQPQPSARVLRWFSPHAYGQLVTTAVTVAELRFGAESMPDSAQRERKHAAIDSFLTLISDVLVMDGDAADNAGRINGHRKRHGRTMSASDSYIAGICAAHDATLATRNIKHFVKTGIDLVNPWDDSV